MKQVAAAFAELARLLRLNGRRLDRAYAAYRARWIPVLEGSPMLTAKTAPRALRREIAGKRFRPIYGYRGIPAPDHKDVIAAMRGK